MDGIQVACLCPCLSGRFVSHFASVDYMPSDRGGNQPVSHGITPGHNSPFHRVISASHNEKTQRAFF
jgi:hypothetical protein